MEFLVSDDGNCSVKPGPLFLFDERYSKQEEIVI